MHGYARFGEVCRGGRDGIYPGNARALCLDSGKEAVKYGKRDGAGVRIYCVRDAWPRQWWLVISLGLGARTVLSSRVVPSNKFKDYRNIFRFSYESCRESDSSIMPETTVESWDPLEIVKKSLESKVTGRENSGITIADIQIPRLYYSPYEYRVGVFRSREKPFALIFE